MTLTRVYPTAGRLVRDSVTRARLPAEGADVDLRDTYWSRRLREGDITDQAPKAEPAAAAPKAAGKKK